MKQLKEAMALAGYEYNQAVSQKERAIIFDNGKPGGVLRHRKSILRVRRANDSLRKRWKCEFR